MAAPAAPPKQSPAKAASNDDDDDDVIPTFDIPIPVAAPIDSPAKPSLAPASAGRLDIGSATSPGRVRERNEDSFLVQHLCWSNRNHCREIGLVIVADGLGGHEAGDQASGMLVHLAGSSLAPLLGGALTGQVEGPTAAFLGAAIDSAIKSANRAIYHRSQTDVDCRGMGSTVAAALIWDGQVMIGHVGDCRVYRFRKGAVTQITKDQTLASKMVDMGQLTAEEAARHPSRNEVLQAVGRHQNLDPAPYQLQIAPGDIMIVACDGLHAHVDQAMLENALRQSPPSASLLAQQLVDLANKNGGSDNCTVVAVRCY